MTSNWPEIWANEGHLQDAVATGDTATLVARIRLLQEAVQTAYEAGYEVLSELDEDCSWGRRLQCLTESLEEVGCV